MMRCHVTYSARDLFGVYGRLIGMKDGYCFVILEGDIHAIALPAEAIDWAGIFRDLEPGENYR